MCIMLTIYLTPGNDFICGDTNNRWSGTVYIPNADNPIILILHINDVSHNIEG